MELRELLCSLEAIDRCGEMRNESVEITNMEAKQAYQKMKMMLKYVFDFEYDSDYIVNRPYLMSKNAQKKAYKNEYAIYQKLRNLIFGDQKKCTFLYYYVLILTLENNSDAQRIKEETHMLFKSIKKNPPQYNRSMIESLSGTRTTSRNKHETIDYYFENVKVPRSISPKARETILLLKAATYKHKTEDDWKQIFSEYRPWEELIEESEMLGEYTKAFFAIGKTYREILDDIWCDFYLAPYGVKKRFVNFNDAEVKLIQYLYILNRTEGKENRIYDFESKEGKKHHKNPNHHNWGKLLDDERQTLAQYLYELYDENDTYMKYIPHVYEHEAETTFFELLSDIIGDDRFHTYLQARGIADACTRIVHNISQLDKAQYLKFKAKINTLYQLGCELCSQINTETEFIKTIKNTEKQNK